jgi:hypothetical protein
VGLWLGRRPTPAGERGRSPGARDAADSQAAEWRRTATVVVRHCMVALVALVALVAVVAVVAVVAAVSCVLKNLRGMGGVHRLGIAGRRGRRGALADCRRRLPGRTVADLRR